MSGSYGPMARRYDRLTGDVPYRDLAGWYAAAVRSGDRAVSTVLDLCCGTGSLSLLLAERGFEMISADASPEMLSVFYSKLGELPASAVPPLLLCQRAEDLDLNDTVDAAVCCLDGFNYFSPEILPRVLERLRLFIAPGGALCFDILSPERMRSLDGGCFVDEDEDMLCLWRAGVQGSELRYGLDIFSRAGRRWDREQEEHTEYIYEPEDMLRALEAAGFGRAVLSREGPQSAEGRLFLSAVRL